MKGRQICNRRFVSGALECMTIFRTCLTALFLAAKIHDHSRKVEQVIKAANFLPGAPHLDEDNRTVGIGKVKKRHGEEQ
ncbi:hypothetical protein TNCT_714471 [Trichonephila clavata]|uniref:Uncharacterized protein n=1 Tax=Trichonephila clavata TaxID=2740835 RepID=A0A8X6HVR9_TRICU|nr:hypothetical protein TNCT_714471 [Trichonephila clavata]